MLRWLGRRLLEEGGWSRVWYGLATAMVIAGGGLIYNQATGGDAASCALPNYPDTTCTGVPSGTSLTSSGAITVTTNGATVDAMDVSGTIYVNANNVTVQNSRAPGIVFNTTKTGLTIQDSEVDCGDTGKGVMGGTSAGGGDPAENLTALRMDVHGCEDGFVLGSNVTVKDSWLHDPGTCCGDPHNDGIQFLDGASNILIEHNNISWRDTSDLQMCNNTGCGTFTDVLIKNNLLFLASGSAYNIYCPQNASSNFVIEGNAFDESSGSIDYVTDCAGETLTGNFLYPSGTPFP